MVAEDDAVREMALRLHQGWLESEVYAVQSESNRHLRLGRLGRCCLVRDPRSPSFGRPTQLPQGHLIQGLRSCRLPAASYDLTDPPSRVICSALLFSIIVSITSREKGVRGGRRGVCCTGSSLEDRFELLLSLPLLILRSPTPSV